MFVDDAGNKCFWSGVDVEVTEETCFLSFVNFVFKWGMEYELGKGWIIRHVFFS